MLVLELGFAARVSDLISAILIIPKRCSRFRPWKTDLAAPGTPAGSMDFSKVAAGGGPQAAPASMLTEVCARGPDLGSDAPHSTLRGGSAGGPV